MIKTYVVGFIFNPSLKKVLMLYRNKMPYQYHWNGIGGRIELGEIPINAFYRELYEESGIYKNELDRVKELATITLPNGIVLATFYGVLAYEPRILEMESAKGSLAWLCMYEHDLLNVANQQLAGDGSVPYLIQFALNLEKEREELAR